MRRLGSEARWPAAMFLLEATRCCCFRYLQVSERLTDRYDGLGLGRSFAVHLGANLFCACFFDRSAMSEVQKQDQTFLVPGTKVLCELLELEANLTLLVPAGNEPIRRGGVIANFWQAHL